MKKTIQQLREEHNMSNTTAEKPKEYWKPNEVAMLTFLMSIRSWDSIKNQAHRIKSYLNNPPKKIEITKVKFK